MQPTGLRWRRIGARRPEEGTELQHAGLAAALRAGLSGMASNQAANAALHPAQTGGLGGAIGGASGSLSTGAVSIRLPSGGSVGGSSFAVRCSRKNN